MINDFKKINKSGFTLVEMMVAIAVFSIVMVVAMSALLNVIDANQKAQTIKTAINNVHFALESISKDMRVGTEYKCLNSDGDEESCDNNGHGGVKYKSHDGKDISYVFNNNKLRKRIGDSGTFNDITSSEINILKAKFYIVKSGCPQTKCQPRMILTLTGEAGTKDKTKTTFDLQTSVSQRIRVK